MKPLTFALLALIACMAYSPSRADELDAQARARAALALAAPAKPDATKDDNRCPFNAPCPSGTCSVLGACGVKGCQCGLPKEAKGGTVCGCTGRADCTCVSTNCGCVVCGYNATKPTEPKLFSCSDGQFRTAAQIQADFPGRKFVDDGKTWHLETVAAPAVVGSPGPGWQSAASFAPPMRMSGFMGGACAGGT